MDLDLRLDDHTVADLHIHLNNRADISSKVMVVDINSSQLHIPSKDINNNNNNNNTVDTRLKVVMAVVVTVVGGMLLNNSSRPLLRVVVLVLWVVLLWDWEVA